MPDLVERNYAREPLKRAEVERILKAAGDTSEVLNSRHKRVRAEGWMDKVPSRAKLVQAILEEPNILRRPILLRGARLLASRDPAEVRRFLR